MGHIISPAILAPVLVAFGLGLGGPVAAEPLTVTLTRQDCQSLAIYLPDPGVAYRPGVDVQGRAVTPADLGGAPRIDLPEVIEIPIEVDLQDRFGIPANADAFAADAQIGLAELHPDGRVYFNGQPLQDDAQFELARRCQEILRDQR